MTRLKTSLAIVTALLVCTPLQAEPTPTEGDALYEMAYETSLPSAQSKRDKKILFSMLNERLKAHDPYAFALNQFGHSRSVETAEKILEAAQTQRQKALAFLCLAEAYFAKQDHAKTVLYSLLSLGTYPSEIHDRQVQFYFKKILGEPVSLLSSKDALLDKFSDIMQKSWHPKDFRGAFDAATVLSLLPQYPIPAPTGESTEPLQLYFGFDDGFTRHAGVALLSAILSADPNTRYMLNIIEDEKTPISEVNKERIQNLSRLLGDDRFETKFIPVASKDLPTILHSYKSKGWPTVSYFRLLIPTWAKDSSRAMWLDSDIIVRSDLTPFYEQDFEDAWFLGIRDMHAARNLTRLAHTYDNSYINGGVILYNIDAIHAGDGLGMMEGLKESYSDYTTMLQFPMQDLMATLYQKRIREVGQQSHRSVDGTSSNSQWNWFALEHPSTQWSEIHRHFAKIIHMEGDDIKPWKSTANALMWAYFPKKNNGVRNMYWSLREMSPWSQL